jgi:hypothetical protein
MFIGLPRNSIAVAVSGGKMNRRQIERKEDLDMLQPIHPLVYAGLSAGLVMYLLGLLLAYFFARPRFLRFLPGLLGLLASLVLLYMDVSMKQGVWQGIDRNMLDWTRIADVPALLPAIPRT